MEGDREEGRTEGVGEEGREGGKGGNQSWEMCYLLITIKSVPKVSGS